MGFDYVLLTQKEEMVVPLVCQVLRGSKIKQEISLIYSTGLILPDSLNLIHDTL
jgi:hypothetical protein